MFLKQHVVENSIEWQKRGLPHAHILIRLFEADCYVSLKWKVLNLVEMIPM